MQNLLQTIAQVHILHFFQLLYGHEPGFRELWEKIAIVHKPNGYILPPRFYVKSILKILGFQKLPFWQILTFKICQKSSKSIFRDSKMSKVRICELLESQKVISRKI